ncbi:Tautomerase pptA [Moraxella lacunata]|uniref:4-oxalocrotonate tautomerase n=1 Tax=Moraxella lacunata TaxID=477 RepID=A0A1V4GRY0_MORLA|nr:4-oxalocrotonate tautomerase [Moraxella lacunata]OPH34896.1 4-oxalocrotonate tautomerase [Moraxella lacunata]STY98683.1 Tautomerase pptA [Moraxella lacunata]
MPHITLQSYPKGLSQAELKTFADELTVLASERLNTPAEYITIDFQELDKQAFKAEVWDKKIAPSRETLLRQPQYEL